MLRQFSTAERKGSEMYAKRNITAVLRSLLPTNLQNVRRCIVDTQRVFRSSASVPNALRSDKYLASYAWGVSRSAYTTSCQIPVISGRF